MILIYALTSTILFGLIGYMMNGSSLAGTIIKFACYAMCCFGIIVTLTAGGFIVKAPAGMHWF